MGVFTAIAVAVKAVVAKITFAAVAKFVGTILVSSLISRVMAKRLGQGSGGGDGGGRIQLPPATDNKIPVVYGSAFLGGPNRCLSNYRSKNHVLCGSISRKNRQWYYKLW